MSEYYLKYYELNKSKNQLLRAGNSISSLSSDYSRVRLSLTGQRGLGLERIREQLSLLARRTSQVRGDIRDLGNFIETLIRETESADLEAKKILNRFSMDGVRQLLKFIQKLLQNLNKLIIAWAGGEAKTTGNTRVEWLSKFMNLGNSEATQTSWEGAGETFASWLANNGIKLFGKKSAENGSVKSGFNTTSFFASWIAGVVGDTWENFSDGEGTFGDDVQESVVEGLLEGAKAAGVVALTGLAIGLFGLTGGGAAVAGAAIGIGVTWVLDLVSEGVFQNDLGMIENLGDVLCNWWDQLAF